MNWVSSDTASWIFFGVGLLSAGLAIVGILFLPAESWRDSSILSSSPPLLPRHPWLRRIGLFLEWSPAVVGPLLLVGGAVLVGLSSGRLSWLSIFAGAICLSAFAYLLLLAKINIIVHRQEHTESSSRQRAEDTLPDLFEDSRAENYLFTHAATGPMYLREMDYPREPDSAPDFEDFASAMVGAGYWMPVSIYTADDNGTDIKDAVGTVLQEFGLESAVEEPPVQGSWFQRIWARGRESEALRERVAELEQALKLAGLGKPQSEIDKNKAEAVAALYEVLKDHENAIIRMGSITIIKRQGNLVAWTIDEMAAADLEKNSELLRDPVAALKFLGDGDQVHQSTGLNEPPSSDILGG